MITLPFGLSFVDIPAACRAPRPPPGEVCTARPRRAACSSRKRPAPLMSHSPRAPLEPARCMQRPRLLPAPLCSNPAVPRARRSLSSALGSPGLCWQGIVGSLLQAVAAMASPPCQSPCALHRPGEGLLRWLWELDVKNREKKKIQKTGEALLISAEARLRNQGTWSQIVYLVYVLASWRAEICTAPIPTARTATSTCAKLKLGLHTDK